MIRKLKVLGSSTIYYRGISGTYDKNYLKNQHIVWFTTDLEYALEYADSKSNVHKFKLNYKHPFDFNFRTLKVHVKISDMTSRIKQGILDLFPAKISREKGLALFERLDKLEEKYPSQMKYVYEWWNEIKELSQIIKDAGFDSIQAIEGNNNSVPTIGMLDKSKIYKVN